MYEVLKKTSGVLAVLSVAAILFASGADAMERSRAIDRSMAPAGVAVNELLGMEVRTQGGEEIASVEDVIVTQQGDVKEVVLDYEGDMVAVPIQDLRISQDHAVYLGTRSDLDAARDFYVYGSGPYVYSRGYREPSGAGVRQDYARPMYQESVPRRGMTGWGAYTPYRSAEQDRFSEEMGSEERAYREPRRGYYTGPGTTPPRGYTGYMPYRERGTSEFGMAEEHIDRDTGYDEGGRYYYDDEGRRYYYDDRGRRHYYEERETAEEFPPRGLTGHMPYSSDQGPSGRFGLD